MPCPFYSPAAPLSAEDALYTYSGHVKQRVIQTFGVGNNIQRTYTGYPERERSAKRANTSQHMSAELNTSNTHSNNARIGYD